MHAKTILEAKGNAVLTTRPETVVAEAIGLMVRDDLQTRHTRPVGDVQK